MNTRVTKIKKYLMILAVFVLVIGTWKFIENSKLKTENSPVQQAAKPVIHAFSASSHPTFKVKGAQSAHIESATRGPASGITAKIEGDMVTVIPTAGFRPGTYTIKVDYLDNGKPETFSKDFAWGVLAINTDRSIYTPGQEAYVQMAALDNAGHTLCNANLQLSIRTPSDPPYAKGEGVFASPLEARGVGGVVERSSTCGPNNYTDQPDYFATTKPLSEVGLYTMVLTNLDNHYQITSTFEVMDSVPFDVQRISTTRTNPYLGKPYTMKFKITANQDFSGQITETLPEGFKTSDPLVWQKNLKKGESIELSYSYDPPKVSPQLYLLGPLTLTPSNPPYTKGEGNSSPLDARGAGGVGGVGGVWKETRLWQIASDNACQSAGTGNWLTAGTWTNCGGTTPQTTDTVEIMSGHTVTMNTSPTVDTLTVDSGGTLTTSQDATANLTVTNTLQVDGTFTVRRSSTAGNGAGQTITAGTLTINSGGSVNADGLGFAAAAGPGYQSAKGGTHGGVGGAVNTKATYGSMTNPTSLGSGGDVAGGGAITISSTGTVTVNGTLSANGAGAGCNNDAGAGGSVNITAATLAGSGTISAKGGTSSNGCGSDTAGGGGRISLNGVTTNTFTGTLSVANGASSFGPAFAGTIYLDAGLRSSLTLGGAGNMTSLRLGSDDADNYTLGTVTVQSGGTLEVTGNPNMNSGNGGAATINVTTLDVQSGGTLSATGFGFIAGPGSGGGTNGGTYGGEGGGNTAATYGSITNPTSFGSGSDARGGGSLIISSSGTVTISGTMSANGSGAGCNNAAGAGGSINITAATLAGSGTISANGGVSSNGCGADRSGGGGRVAVILTSGTTFSPTMSAYGGASNSNGISAAGTIYQQGSDDISTTGDLIINNNNLNTVSGIDTSISSSVTNTSVGTITMSNSAKLTVEASQTLTTNSTGTTLTINSGTTLTNYGTLSLAGTTFTNSGTFTPHSGSTTTYTGQSNDSTVTMLSSTYAGLTVNNAGTIFNEGGATTASASLNITAGTYNLNGNNLTATGATMTNLDTFQLKGSETVTGLTMDTAQGTTVYNGTGTYTGLAAGNSYYSLTFNSNTGPQGLPSGRWNLNAGLTVNGNFTRTAGTFNAGAQTVTFAGSDNSTLRGNTTFYNFTAATNDKKLRFTAGQDFQINGLLTITGTSGHQVQIVSTASGSQWFINHQGTEAVTYATIRDSGCNASSTIITVSTATNTNAGNNGVCWSFDGATEAARARTPNVYIKTSPANGVGWYSSSWTNRRKITLDHNKVQGGANLTNFPVLVSKTLTDFKFTSFGGNVASSSGGDLLFTDSDGTTKLSFEIEKYSSSSGQVIAWVKAPTLYSAQDTTMYLYYGGPTNQNNQSNTTWDSNFKGVWHLPTNNAGTTLTTGDSTSNANDGTNVGATAGTGKIDGAGSFDAATHYITSPYHVTNSAHSISAWFSTTLSTREDIWASSKTAANAGFTIIEVSDTTNCSGSGRISYLTRDDASNTDPLCSNKNTYKDGVLHFVEVTWDGTTKKLYIDGVLDTTSTPTFGTASPVSSAIGALRGNSNAFYFNGTIDEVRVSNSARTAGWVATEYKNQATPSSFESFGGIQARTRSAPVVAAVSQASSGVGWYSGSWTYRRKITLDRNKVQGGANLSSFPVLVSKTLTDFKYTSFGGNVASSSGGDLLFTDSDGTTKLSFEIEKYSSSSGNVIAWVKLPTLSATSDTSLYLYYGGPTNQNNQSTGTWSNSFGGVWHLKENPTATAPQMKDSTSNANDGTSNGSQVAGDQQTAQIDGGIHFDGSNDYEDVGTGLDQNGEITISTWFKPTTVAVGTMALLGNGGGTDEDYRLEINRTAARLDIVWANTTIVTGVKPLVAGTWYHAVAVRSGSSGNWTATLYLNGVLDNSATTATNPNAASLQTSIGRNGNSAFFFFNGLLDEMRLSSTARTAGWIATEYKNQSSPGAFHAFGGVEARVRSVPARKVR